MTDIKAKRTRREFFVRGGAVLGAGVATTAAANALLAEPAASMPDKVQQLQDRPDSLDDRETIRRLHLNFTVAIERQEYEAATQLFHEDAHVDLGGLTAAGSPAIARLFTQQYRQQQLAALHTAYRQTASQLQDVVTVSDDHTQATAMFHTEVQISTPLRDDFTVAQMARLQGQTAVHRWESGRFDARYVKVQGLWRMASLRYSQT